MSTPVGTVFIVDDDPAVLRALARLLRSRGFEVKTFASARDFLRGHDASAPGCLLLDVAMPETDGLKLQESLAATDAHRMIVFMSGLNDIRTAIRAMKSGAVHFLTKPVDGEDLVRAVHEALEKDRVARMERAEMISIGKRFATLTPRERQVLEHVVNGSLNKQTAAALGTAEKTVKVHRARLMRKMEAGSVAELVRLVERMRAGKTFSPPM